MTEREQGYIEGLNAAALLCEYHTKGKDSRFAPLIRQLAQKFMLTLDAQSKIAHNGE